MNTVNGPPAPSFCVILPMFNEQDSARACVLGILEFLRTEAVSSAIVAVNDGSSDSTAAVLAKLQETSPELTVESHCVNSGYGAAVRTGFAAALRGEWDYALVMDADGTQNPEFIRGFYPPMRASVDFIKATRYAKGGHVEGVSWKRRIVSWAGNKLARITLRTSLTDYTNGFRAIRTGFLPHLTTTESGFPVLLEEVYLAAKKGATFAEVPYTLAVRQGSESKSKFIYSLSVYATYLKYLIKP